MARILKDVETLIKQNIDALNQKISLLLPKDTAEEMNKNIDKNEKEILDLSQSINSIEKVREAIENEVPGDLLSIDLRNVIDSVGEITGEISNDEMLGNIFSNFCIGK